MVQSSSTWQVARTPVPFCAVPLRGRPDLGLYYQGFALTLSTKFQVISILFCKNSLPFVREFKIWPPVVNTPAVQWKIADFVFSYASAVSCPALSAVMEQLRSYLGTKKPLSSLESPLFSDRTSVKIFHPGGLYHLLRFSRRNSGP